MEHCEQLASWCGTATDADAQLQSTSSDASVDYAEALQRVEEAVLRWPSAACALEDPTSLRDMVKGRQHCHILSSDPGAL